MWQVHVVKAEKFLWQKLKNLLVDRGILCRICGKFTAVISDE